MDRHRSVSLISRVSRQGVMVAVLAIWSVLTGLGGEAPAAPLDEAPAPISPEVVESSPGRPFDRGSQLRSWFGGRTFDTALGQVDLIQFTKDRYYAPGRARQWGWVAGFIRARQSRDGLFGGPVFGMRRHLTHGRQVSLYLGGSFGAVWHEHSVTPESLRFNFDIQGGPGILWRMNDRLFLQAGIRWYHLSNARVAGKDQNLGYDSPMLYFGFLMR